MLGGCEFERALFTIHSAKTWKTNDVSKTRNVPVIPEMKILLDHLATKPHSPQDAVCAVGECENP